MLLRQGAPHLSSKKRLRPSQSGRLGLSGRNKTAKDWLSEVLRSSGGWGVRSLVTL